LYLTKKQLLFYLLVQHIYAVDSLLYERGNTSPQHLKYHSHTCRKGKEWLW